MFPKKVDIEFSRQAWIKYMKNLSSPKKQIDINFMGNLSNLVYTQNFHFLRNVFELHIQWMPFLTPYYIYHNTTPLS